MDILQFYQKRWYAENAPLGKLLGYPECCIKAFCDQPPELLQQTKRTADDLLRFKAGWVNDQFTGFIPCITHAKEIMAGNITLAELIHNRDARFPPFPEHAFQGRSTKENNSDLFVLLLLLFATGMVVGYQTKNNE